MATLNGIDLFLNDDGTVGRYQDAVNVFDTEQEQGFNLRNLDLEERAEDAAEDAGMEYVTFINQLNLKSYKQITVNGEVFGTFDEEELKSKLN